MTKIDEVCRFIEKQGQALAARNGTTIELQQYYVSRAAPTDERLRRLVADASEALGLSTLSMPSGAGHDAQSIALLAPVGMIFIPSVDGISHSPDELSRPSDIEAGANVLLQTVLATDALDLSALVQLPASSRQPPAVVSRQLGVEANSAVSSTSRS